MNKKNSIFIATSIDGYIADKNGGIDWLHTLPNPEQVDMGYSEFMEKIDAIVMGRKTFETVLGFDIDWPYVKPVFVLSNTLAELPENLWGSVFILKGNLNEIINQIHKKGYYRLYIDGGNCIQSFLKEDKIDEMILTTIPILLGGGSTLFTEIPKELNFELVESKTFLKHVSQRHYKRKKPIADNIKDSH